MVYHSWSTSMNDSAWAMMRWLQRMDVWVVWSLIYNWPLRLMCEWLDWKLISSINICNYVVDLQESTEYSPITQTIFISVWLMSSWQTRITTIYMLQISSKNLPQESTLQEWIQKFGISDCCSKNKSTLEASVTPEVLKTAIVKTTYWSIENCIEYDGIYWWLFLIVAHY